MENIFTKVQPSMYGVLLLISFIIFSIIYIPSVLDHAYQKDTLDNEQLSSNLHNQTFIPF